MGMRGRIRGGGLIRGGNASGHWLQFALAQQSDWCWTLHSDWWRAGQSAIVGGALGGLGNALGIEAKAAGAGRGLGNPFKGKTANQIADMFERKGFKPKGPSPRTGQGTYVNPSSGRGYHIDANHPAPKGPHVGVKPPRGSGVRDSRDFPM
jgi:hypothetical protein